MFFYPQQPPPPPPPRDPSWTRYVLFSSHFINPLYHPCTKKCWCTGLKVLGSWNIKLRVSSCPAGLYFIDWVTSDFSAQRCAHAYSNFYCSLPCGVHAHHGLFRARAFETPITFHEVAKSHWTVQWFIQAKTSLLPLLIINPIYTHLKNSPCFWKTGWQPLHYLFFFFFILGRFHHEIREFNAHAIPIMELGYME